MSIPVPKKRPTVKDVAARAGVSKSLVSLVLHDSPKVSDSSRARVLEAIETLQYRPNELARSLVSRHSHLLGIVVDAAASRRWSRAIDRAQQAAIDLGYTPIVTACEGTTGQRKTFDTLLGLRVDGLVLIGCEPGEAQTAELAGRVPLAAIGTPQSELADAVVVDEAAGAHIAVNHLVSLGHRRIVHLTGGPGAIAAARMEGFITAMRSHGLKPHVLPGGQDDRSAAAATRDLLERLDPPPTAILAATNAAAAAALIEARQLTRVPEDLSLIGFDDSDITRLHGIDLTVIRAPVEDMGTRIVELVVDRVDSEADPRTIPLQPTLVSRRTTGPAPGGEAT